MRNILSFLFVIFIMWGCTPKDGTVFGPEGLEGGLPGLPSAPVISSLQVNQAEMNITGENLETVVSVKFTGTGGYKKEFRIKSKTFYQIIAEAIDATSIPVGVALDMVLSNAHAQSSFPITFTLQPDSVGTMNIQNGAATRLKLHKESTDNPDDGQVLKWHDASGTFQFADDAGAGEGGTGTVTNVNLGAGIVGDGTSETIVANIVVDTDTTGDLSLTKIPFFNNDNELVLDSSGGPPLTKLVLEDAVNSFSIFNDGTLRIRNEGGRQDLLVMAIDGLTSFTNDIVVRGQAVCLADGSNCSDSGGTIWADYPVLASTNGSDTTISVDTGTERLNLVQLDGSGALPAVDGSNLTGVVNEIVPGAAINVADLLGGSTVVGVRFGGAGNAQQYRDNLDNLGTIPILTNGVVIGNLGGTAFESQAGATLLGSIGAQPYDSGLEDIASLIPLDGTFIRGNGASWEANLIPNCITGQVVTGDGDNFVCTDTLNQIFYGGTFQSNNQDGFVLMPDSDSNAPGEIQFFETTGAVNYVGLKAPSTIATNTVWTLPNADGTDGQALVTNGAGVLTWAASVSEPTVNPQTGTSYTLTSNDCGNTVTLNNGAAINLSVPVLTVGCEVDIIQLGAGQVTNGGIGGMVVQNAFNLFRTRAQYSVVTVKIITGTLAIVSGDIN